MSTGTTRILSDLHYSDPGSWLDDVSQLEPLLPGIQRLVLNGDSLDTQINDQPEQLVAHLRTLFEARVPEVTFLAGNHDPDISESDEEFLAENRVWVTHGHVFFDDVAPWSRLAPEIRRRLRAHASEADQANFANLEHRFRLFRLACLKLPREVDPTKRGTLARLSRIAHAILPPQKLLSMLRMWRVYPQLVERVSAAQRPKSQVVVTGHTHFHGVWPQPSGRTIINTGSLCPPRGGLLVDVTDDGVTVKKIIRCGRELHSGEVVAEIALAPTRPSKLSASA